MPGISKSTLIRGGAIGAAVAGGALAGALLLAPAVSVAQDPTPSPEASAETTPPAAPETPGTTPSPGTTPDPDDDELCGHFWHGGFGGFETVADALGISEEELRDALRDGKSIATIADERGVELQTVVDAMVAAGTERIDDALADGRIDEERANELKAELPDRVNDVVQRTDWPWWPGRGWGWGEGRWGWWGPGPGPGGFGGLDAAADALGIEEEALWDALGDGRSIADVAADQGVDLQMVQDALVAEATERIDAALADGRIDEEQANELKAELPDRVGDFVQRSAPWRPGLDKDDDEPAGTEEPSSTDLGDRSDSSTSSMTWPWS